MRRKLTLMFLILMALIQLFVPAQMIYNLEDVLDNGKEYKFKTAPIDPNDPFRGKFIWLNFTNNTIDLSYAYDYGPNESVFVTLKEDEDGFAIIDTISKRRPDHHSNYLKSSISYVNDNTVTVEFPFDRFYMDENKAEDAEKEYRYAQASERVEAYALVMVRNGDAVIRDVLIGGRSIVDLVDERARENK